MERPTSESAVTERQQSWLIHIKAADASEGTLADYTKAQRREEHLQRIPIEGKFRQGKNGYRLNYIRAKLPKTSSARINSIFMVMHLLVLLRALFGLGRQIAVSAFLAASTIFQQLIICTLSATIPWKNIASRGALIN